MVTPDCCGVWGVVRTDPLSVNVVCECGPTLAFATLLPVKSESQQVGWQSTTRD